MRANLIVTSIKADVDTPGYCRPPNSTCRAICISSQSTFTKILNFIEIIFINFHKFTYTYLSVLGENTAALL